MSKQKKLSIDKRKIFSRAEKTFALKIISAWMTGKEEKKRWTKYEQGRLSMLSEF